MSFQSDLSDSAQCFERIVYPVIRGLIGGGRLISVESIADSHLALLLDRCAGLDWIQITNDGYLRGLSSRIQFGRDYGTFTIRRKRSNDHRTEYERLRYLSNNNNRGYITSGLTIQSYVSDRHRGRLLSCAIAYTHDLNQYILEHDNLPVRRAPDGNEFCVISWHDLAIAHVPVKIVRPPL